ncbi:EamA-like transporter family protein [Shimia sp. SK013]|uniref:DMT family transporter n=1 Tax=Shimia sp. SK013 TaxID=1389006 RepID=UPI0006B519FF|nr:DMT family transporter [Shimia sp. SK013]KPA22880.1 EamA-like transporter family protein [Shimia sp. SK013]
MSPRKEALLGVALVVLYTGAISCADAITKHIASGYTAPQLFAISGLAVAGLCMLVTRPAGTVPRTRLWRPTLARCALGIVASVAFFLSFRLLPMAEVFLFIGLMPIMSATLSGPMLGERLQPGTWFALALGALGVFFLFPDGLHNIGAGHAVALCAAITGSLSLVLARYISNRERASLAQVFYPNLAMGAVMALALPFVWRPMGTAELLLVAAYSVALFAARWLCVLALRLLPVHVVTLLMSLQFVWMVWLGGRFFGEVPGMHVYIGAAVVTAAGAVLVLQRMMPQPGAEPVSKSPT